MAKINMREGLQRELDMLLFGEKEGHMRAALVSFFFSLTRFISLLFNSFATAP